MEAEGSCCHTKHPCCTLVTDINVWTECFATMAAILSSAFLAKAPQSFAYLRTITKASNTFQSSAWASYYMAYCCQAANRGSLDWGVVNAALYSEAFASQTKQIPHCRYCLVDTHSSPECPHALSEGSTDHTDGCPAQTAPHQSRAAGHLAVEICRLFNSRGGLRCHFPQCRYTHLCAKCRRLYPVAECRERRQQTNPVQSASTATQGGSSSSILK